MSNKPKIHAFCDAGCKWETVHKDDFLASASHIPVALNSAGGCTFSIGKEYKIFAPKDSDNNFTSVLYFSYLASGVNTNFAIAHTNNDKYAEWFVFRPLEVIASDTAITIVYELAGVRYTETISGSGLSVPTDCFLVSGATKVLLYNYDAVISLKAAVDSDLLFVYPVGSIYISTNSTSPASLFGGTWERIQDKFLLSAGSTYTAGSEGGNATHSHSLDNSTAYAKIALGAPEGIPSDSVVMSIIGASGGYDVQRYAPTSNNYSPSGIGKMTTGTPLAGDTASSNNIPPYLAVYMWKRTA